MGPLSQFNNNLQKEATGFTRENDLTPKVYSKEDMDAKHIPVPLPLPIKKLTLKKGRERVEI